jgi:hypothetical protein
MAFDIGVAWAFVGAGAATQAGAFMLLRRPFRLMRAGGSGNGVVVDSEESMQSATNGGPSSRYFFDVVEFTTRHGRAIRFTSAAGRHVSRAKGSSVRVLYDPDDPNNAELVSFASLWLMPLVTSLFGLPFLIAGLSAVI